MTREKIAACPFEAPTRAARCESCCDRTGGLTPCVAAWLAAKAGYVELVEPAAAEAFRPLLRAA